MDNTAESNDLVLSTPDSIEPQNTDKPSPLAGHRWQAGQSGNPGGRPKHDYSAKLARLVLEKSPDKLQDALSRCLYADLKRGSAKVYKILAERGYGKLPQPMEHAGAGGGAIQIVLGCDVPKWAKNE